MFGSFKVENRPTRESEKTDSTGSAVGSVFWNECSLGHLRLKKLPTKAS